MKALIFTLISIITILLALLIGEIAKVQQQLELLSTISASQYRETHRCTNGNQMWVDREYNIRCDREIVNK
jgi:hypothetical protein